jgi:hypothetical protein
MNLLFHRRSTFRLLAGILAAAAALAAAPSIRASLVPAMGLTELTERADRVVVGDIVSVRSDWDRGRRWIYTTIEVNVAEVWKGQASRAGRLKMVQPGGSVGDIEQRVFGLRSFRTGDRAVLFLGPGDPAWSVGLGQGQRLMRFDTHQRRWLVDQGDRSAAFRAGTSRDALPDGVLALDDLRQRVRALVRP